MCVSADLHNSCDIFTNLNIVHIMFIFVLLLIIFGVSFYDVMIVYLKCVS